MSKYPDHETQLRFLRDAVKYAPVIKDQRDNQIPCLRPETFAVMFDISDIGTDNWGFDSNIKYEDFYFNRTLEQKSGSVGEETVKYPAVFMMASPGDSLSYKSFFDRPKKVINYELAVVDIFRNECYKGRCSKRPQQRIIFDCEKILESILIYFKGIVFATYDDKKGWFHKNELQWLLDAEKISSFQVDQRTSDLYMKKIKEINNDGNFKGDIYKDLSINSLYGVYVNISLPIEQCILGEYTFREYGDYKFGKCY